MENEITYFRPWTRLQMKSFNRRTDPIFKAPVVTKLFNCVASIDCWRWTPSDSIIRNLSLKFCAVWTSFTSVTCSIGGASEFDVKFPCVISAIDPRLSSTLVVVSVLRTSILGWVRVFVRPEWRAHDYTRLRKTGKEPPLNKILRMVFYFLVLVLLFLMKVFYIFIFYYLFISPI